MNNDTEKRMQSCINKLNIPLIVWIPDQNATKHGKIDLNSKTLLIFDEKEK